MAAYVATAAIRPTARARLQLGNRSQLEKEQDDEVGKRNAENREMERMGEWENVKMREMGGTGRRNEKMGECENGNEMGGSGRMREWENGRMKLQRRMGGECSRCSILRGTATHISSSGGYPVADHPVRPAGNAIRIIRKRYCVVR